MSVMSRKLLAILLLILSGTVAYAESLAPEFEVTMVRGRVFRKEADDQPFALEPGGYKISSATSLLTFVDGQCYLQMGKNLELRMKEEAILALSDHNDLMVRKGLVGFRSVAAPIQIKTLHLNVEFADGLLVIKSNSILTRVCLIKGTARVRQGNAAAVELKEGQEIAAAPGKLSQPYERSDELRFTWYWVTPDKEPALQ